MITEKQKQALSILRETTWQNPMRVAEFARRMWPDSNMHASSKNQGNGATRGKAAWLCGGSYLAKLQKLKLVYKTYADNGNGVSVAYITELGKQRLTDEL